MAPRSLTHFVIVGAGAAGLMTALRAEYSNAKWFGPQARAMTIDLTGDEIWFLKALRAGAHR
jgi:NADH dehydrogenase FAD-containing subunit